MQSLVRRNIATPKSVPVYRKSSLIAVLIAIVSVLPFLFALFSVDSTQKTDHPVTNPTPDPPIDQPPRFFEPFGDCRTDPSLIPYCSITLLANYFSDVSIAHTPYEGAPESYVIYQKFLAHFSQNPQNPLYAVAKSVYENDPSVNGTRSFSSELSRLTHRFDEMVKMTAMYRYVRSEPHLLGNGRSQMASVEDFHDILNISLDATDDFISFLYFQNLTAVNKMGLGCYLLDNHHDPGQLIDLYRNWSNHTALRNEILSAQDLIMDYFKLPSSYHQVVTSIGSKIRNLKNDEQLVIPGGWTRHSMAYGVTKRLNQTVEITILNAGYRPWFHKERPRRVFGAALIQVGHRLILNESRWIGGLSQLLNPTIYHVERCEAERAYYFFNLLLPDEFTLLEPKMGIGAFSGTCNKDAPQLSFRYLTQDRPYGVILDLAMQVDWLETLLRVDSILDDVPSHIVRDARYSAVTMAKTAYEEGLLPEAAYREIHRIIEPFRQARPPLTQANASALLPTDLSQFKTELDRFKSKWNGRYNSSASIPFLSKSQSKLPPYPSAHSKHFLPPSIRNISTYDDFKNAITSIGIIEKNKDLRYGVTFELIRNLDISTLLTDPLLNPTHPVKNATQVLCDVIADIVHLKTEFLEATQNRVSEFSILIKHDYSLDTAVGLLKLLVIGDAVLRRNPLYDQTRFQVTDLQNNPFEVALLSKSLIDIRFQKDIVDIIDYSRRYRTREITSFYGIELDSVFYREITGQTIDSAPDTIPELLFGSFTRGISTIARFYTPDPDDPNNAILHSIRSLMAISNGVRALISSDEAYQSIMKRTAKPTPETDLMTYFTLRTHAYDYKVFYYNQYFTKLKDQLPIHSTTLGNAIACDTGAMTVKKGFGWTVPNSVKRAYFAHFQNGVSLVEAVSFFKRFPFYSRDNIPRQMILNTLRSQTLFQDVPVPRIVENLLMMDHPVGFFSQCIDDYRDFNFIHTRDRSSLLAYVELMNVISDAIITAHRIFPEMITEADVQATLEKRNQFNPVLKQLRAQSTSDTELQLIRTATAIYMSRNEGPLDPDEFLCFFTAAPFNPSTQRYRYNFQKCNTPFSAWDSYHFAISTRSPGLLKAIEQSTFPPISLNRSDEWRVVEEEWSRSPLWVSESGSISFYPTVTLNPDPRKHPDFSSHDKEVMSQGAKISNLLERQFGIVIPWSPDSESVVTSGTTFSVRIPPFTIQASGDRVRVMRSVDSHQVWEALPVDRSNFDLTLIGHYTQLKLNTTQYTSDLGEILMIAPLGVHFVQNQGRISSPQFPGFQLVQAPLRHIEPVTTRPHFLMSDGNRHQLIVPMVPISRPLKGNETSIPYFVYSLDDHYSNPTSELRDAQLYLALCYGYSGHLEIAAQMIDSVAQNLPISTDLYRLIAEELESVPLNTGIFQSPNGNALWLKWALLRHRISRFDPNLFYEEFKKDGLKFKYFYRLIGGMEHYFKGLAANKVEKQCQLSHYQISELMSLFNMKYGYEDVNTLVSNQNLWASDPYLDVKPGRNSDLHPLPNTPIVTTLTNTHDPLLFDGSHVQRTETQRSPVEFPISRLDNRIHRVRIGGMNQLFDHYNDIPIQTATIALPSLLNLADQIRIARNAALNRLNAVLDPVDGIAQLNIASGKAYRAQMGDLFQAFVRGTIEGYTRFLPQKTEAEIVHIHHLVGDYLVQASRLGLINAVVHPSQDNSATVQPVEALLNRFDSDLNSVLDRAILVYQFGSGHVPNRRQLAAINRLLSHEGWVEEMRPGSGKSSMILPLLTYYHSLSTHGLGTLVIATPPKLVKPMTESIERALRPVGIPVHYFHFQRNYTAISEGWQRSQYVKRMRNHIQHALATRSPIVMSSTTHRSLLARAVELSNQYQITFSAAEEMSYLHEIIATLDTCPTVIDEKDEVDSFRDEFNFAYGAPLPPNPTDIKAALDVLDTWHSHPHIQDLIHSAPSGTFEARRLGTGGSYHRLISVDSSYFKETVLPAIATVHLDDLCAIYGFAIPQDQRSALTLYVLGGRRRLEENQKLESMVQSYESRFPDLSTRLSILKTILSQFLPHLLTKNPFTDYAPFPPNGNPGQELVRPYSQGIAKGPSTYFQTPIMSILATAHYYRLIGPSRDGFINTMSALIASARRESESSAMRMQLTRCLTRIVNLPKWPGPISPLEIDVAKPEIADFLYTHLKHDPQLWRLHVNFVVNQELVLFPKKIVIPPLNIIGNGMSATNMFSACYARGTHVEVDPMTAVSEVVSLRPGNDDLDIVYKTDPESLYSLIVSAIQSGDDAYLDGANYLPFPIESIITALETQLDRYPRRPDYWVYVSSDDSLKMQRYGRPVSEPYSITTLQGKRAFYYLAQHHGRGTDFPIRSMLMSVDVKKPEDLTQNDGRNRGVLNAEESGHPIGKGHTTKTRWLVSHSLIEAAAKKLDLSPHQVTKKSQFKEWLSLISAEQDITVYISGFTIQIEHVVYRAAMRHLNPYKSEKKATQTALQFFIRDTPLRPDLSLVSEVSTETYFNDIATGLIKKFETILTPSEQKEIKMIARTAAKFSGFGPTILTPQSTLDYSTTVEIDVSQAANQNANHDTKTDQHQELSKDVLPEDPWDIGSMITSGNTSQLVPIHTQLADRVILPQPIFLSNAFLLTHHSQLKLSQSDREQLGSGPMKRLNWALVVPSSDGIQLIGLSLFEADRAREWVRRSPISIALFSTVAFNTPLISSPGYQSIPPSEIPKLRQTVLFINQEISELNKEMDAHGSFLHVTDSNRLLTLIKRLQKATFSGTDQEEIYRLIR